MKIDEIAVEIYPDFTTKGGKCGSGYGPPWCKNLVELIHEVKIWFESTVGVGTTFHLKIPIWKGDALIGKSS